MDGFTGGVEVKTHALARLLLTIDDYELAVHANNHSAFSRQEFMNYPPEAWSEERRKWVSEFEHFNIAVIRDGLKSTSYPYLLIGNFTKDSFGWATNDRLIKWVEVPK